MAIKLGVGVPMRRPARRGYKDHRRRRRRGGGAGVHMGGVNRGGVRGGRRDGGGISRPGGGGVSASSRGATLAGDSGGRRGGRASHHKARCMHATHPKPTQFRTREAHLSPRRQQRRQPWRTQLRPLRRQRARRPAVALPATPDFRAQRAQAVGTEQPTQRLLRLVRAQDGTPSCGPAHRSARERRPERAACLSTLSMGLKEGDETRRELREIELGGEAREPARRGAWRLDLLAGSSDLVGSSDGRRIGHLARQRRVLQDVKRAARA